VDFFAPANAPVYVVAIRLQRRAKAVRSSLVFIHAILPLALFVLTLAGGNPTKEIAFANTVESHLKERMQMPQERNHSFVPVSASISFSVERIAIYGGVATIPRLE